MMLEDEIVIDKGTETAAVERPAGLQVPQNAQDGQNGEPEKKYTDEDMNRIVSRRLERERRKMAKAAPDQQRENELDERERNILAREQELTKRELKASAYGDLAAAGLPFGAVDLLDYSSEDGYKASFEKLQRIIEDQREAWERERARGTVPKAYRTQEAPDPVADAFKPKLS